MAELLLEPGAVIGNRYRVVRRLGAGGMGAVYEAEHLELGRTVAVKVLLPNLTSNPDITARFMREARAAAQIGHPGIVQVFDLGTDANVPFLVMEKLEGEELSARIERERPLPINWVIEFAIDLCDALQAAHDHGIVHRDLKPSNVFLARQGRRSDVLKVLDFGIAKLMRGADEIRTRTGEVFGTPLYMAPEQLRDSKDVDGRADVYAIGCILFQALTGTPPFQATTYPDLVLRICSGPRPRVRQLRADVSESLSGVIERAMSMEAAERYVSPAELARALGAPDASIVTFDTGGSGVGSAPTVLASSAAALDPHSRTAPPEQPAKRRRTALAVLGVIGVGLAGWIFVRARVRPDHSVESGSQDTAESTILAPTRAASPTPPAVQLSPALEPVQPSASDSATPATAPNASAAPTASRGDARPLTQRRLSKPSATAPARTSAPTAAPPPLIPP